jgi:hypothetical protein
LPGIDVPAIFIAASETPGQACASDAFIQQNGFVFNVRVAARRCPGTPRMEFSRKMND